MQTNIDLQGLRVAVTGGTSGLGLALVRQLAEQGASVAFVARTTANVERIADDGARSKPGVGAASASQQSRMPRAFPPPAIPRSTCASLLTSRTASLSAPRRRLRGRSSAAAASSRSARV